MEKIYFTCIYLLVIFCAGCAVAEMFTSIVSPLGLFLVASGIGLLVYTIGLMKEPAGKSELSRIPER
jgi:hypothetical protein